MSSTAAASSGSASPRTEASAPSRISSSPLPPASTTPAWRRIASSSGVRATELVAALAAAASTAFQTRITLGRDSRGLGHVACHGQDRALDRLGNSSEGRRATLAQRLRQLGATDRIRLVDGLPEATEDLRQDHAAVAARAHQCAEAQRRGHARNRPLGLGHPLGLVYRRLDRGQHVRARIPVGDRKDVERVHLVDASVQQSPGEAKGGQQVVAVPRAVDHALGAWGMFASAPALGRWLIGGYRLDRRP